MRTRRSPRSARPTASSATSPPRTARPSAWACRCRSTSTRRSQQGGRRDGIKVTSSSGQQVVGHWFDDDRAGLAPRGVLEGRLHGHPEAGAGRRRGRRRCHRRPGEDRHASRSAATRSRTVDAKTKTMNVTQDGKTIKTIPISAGSPEHTDVQRPDGDLREVQADPDERRDRRLHRRRTARASTTSRTSRTPCGCPPPAPSSTATTGATTSIFGNGQHQPRLRRPERHQGRQRPRTRRRLVLQQLA